MATVTFTQKIVQKMVMRVIRLDNYNGVKSYFNPNDPNYLLSYEEGVDLEKNQYWQLVDDVNGRLYIVEVPRAAIPGRTQEFTTKLLEQYSEFHRIIFGEWERYFGARVIEPTIESLQNHSTLPLADRDRIYFRVGAKKVLCYGIFTAKKHKSPKK